MFNYLAMFKFARNNSSVWEALVSARIFNKTSVFELSLPIFLERIL